MLRSTTRLQLVRGGASGTYLRSSLLSTPILSPAPISDPKLGLGPIREPTTADSVIHVHLYHPHYILSTHIFVFSLPFPLFPLSSNFSRAAPAHPARKNVLLVPLLDGGADAGGGHEMYVGPRRSTRVIFSSDLRPSRVAMAWKSSIFTVSQYTSYRFPRGRLFRGFLISCTQINMFQSRTRRAN